MNIELIGCAFLLAIIAKIAAQKGATSNTTNQINISAGFY